MTTSSFETRKRLLQLAQTYPGLHMREIARQADLSEALAGYHLDALVAEGLMSSVAEEGFRRFYPAHGAAPSEPDRELVALFRQRVPLQITLILLARPRATHAEITEELGLAKSTVSHHLAKLKGARVVVTSPDGRLIALREPKRVERLLLRWEPPEDLIDRFSELWRNFYSRRKRT